MAAKPKARKTTTKKKAVSKKAKSKKRKPAAKKHKPASLAHATASPALRDWYRQICDLVDDMVDRGKKLDANSRTHAEVSVGNKQLARAKKWQVEYNTEVLPTVRGEYVKDLTRAVVDIVDAIEVYHRWLTSGAYVVRRDAPLPDKLGVSSEYLTVDLRKLVQVDLKKLVALVAIGSPPADRASPPRRDPGGAVPTSTVAKRTDHCIQITHSHSGERSISRAEYKKLVAAQKKYTLFIDFTDTVSGSLYRVGKKVKKGKKLSYAPRGMKWEGVSALVRLVRARTPIKATDLYPDKSSNQARAFENVRRMVDSKLPSGRYQFFTTHGTGTAKAYRFDPQPPATYCVLFQEALLAPNKPEPT